MIRQTRFAAFLLSALLAACAPRDAPPAPVVRHGAPSSPVASVTPIRLTPPASVPVLRPIAASAGTTVTVRPGETLSGIARRHGLETAAVARANGLKPPYGVQAGQKLTLPGPTDVGHTFVASTRAAPDRTRPDPRPLAVRAPSIPAPAAEPISNATVASAPRSSVQSATLTAPQPPMTPIAVKIEAPRAEAPPAAPAKVDVAKAEPEAAAAPIAAPAPPRPTVGEPPPRAGRNFLWPVKGRLISSYGPQPGGLRNDGLNIAASRGDRVIAADNGVVAYSGDDLKGFGNLVLVKHAGGFVTAYAHNDKLLVKRGDKVRRGQAIATVGESGSVTQPQVHFQVRQGAHAVDPRPLMERS
ncbi:MAG: LysM peptidoglycan-binding domain-containing protein [Alphaproteobacteria bacterium]|nr:LysM peptidoglycan-binding domain-containing protein [Alphaproteobacteria bacterium]